MFIRTQVFRIATRVFFSLIFLASVTPTANAQAASARDVVVVLPFENTSSQPEYNWVGESFADALSELLNVPGLAVVSSDERGMAYQRLRLPLTVVPTRATAIKLAREAKATLVVIGTYNVSPAQGERTQAELLGTARVIRVNEGRWTGEMMADGNWAWQPYDFGGALQTLQSMQGRLAYQMLYQRDKALAFSLNQFVERATKVPPRAFESYMKGIMTDDAEKRSNYLQNAMREYAKANAGATYAQASFELGQHYFKQGDWKRAAEYFSNLQKRDRHFAEAAFYSALAYYRQGDLVRALGALLPLTTDTPLTGIYNNAGAISVQAARLEKKPEERARLLTQAVGFLQRAAESTPDDPFVRFNYAYALFLSGKSTEAADQLRPVITNDPRDGAAYYLFAKSLARAGNAEAAAAADNEARRYLQSYAKWEAEWQKSQTTPDLNVRLHQDFNLFTYYAIQSTSVASTESAGVNAQDLLAKARELYQAGRDDEAVVELNRVLVAEPTNAQLYLLLGRIKQRRGDLEAAVNMLRTATFWDAKLIDAHILLGRIFLERGDRAQALTYARNAINLDANNQEAIALLRQVETGGR
ncbi:MAG: tetratricopeptide repeat protein [Pyrinomonadaceae bacterium]|nr:tetratricopeptide repeat protein [Pyrinomonadaceae bacterium]